MKTAAAAAVFLCPLSLRLTRRVGGYTRPAENRQRKRRPRVQRTVADRAGSRRCGKHVSFMTQAADARLRWTRGRRIPCVDSTGRVEPTTLRPLSPQGVCISRVCAGGGRRACPPCTLNDHAAHGRSRPALPNKNGRHWRPFPVPCLLTAAASPAPPSTAAARSPHTVSGKADRHSPPQRTDSTAPPISPWCCRNWSSPPP